MKYLNTLNGVVYHIENGDLMMSKGGVTINATMEIDTFNAMVRDGEMVQVSDKEAFTARVKEIYSSMRGTNIRYIAYCVDTGVNIKCNTKGMHHFMNWIADRNRDYADKHPEMLHPALGSGVIVDQNHFTKFIVSGEWM